MVSGASMLYYCGLLLWQWGLLLWLGVQWLVYSGQWGLLRITTVAWCTVGSGLAGQSVAPAEMRYYNMNIAVNASKLT